MANYKDIKYQFPASATNSGTFADARIAASNVSQHATSYDDNKLQSNIALLGFKTAVNGSLAKYNLQDQIIDEYTDATGVDASASTNELLTAGVYSGGTTTTPTVTQDADATGTDGDYTWYKWTDTGSTGSYNSDTTQTHDWLVVGGGGAGYGNRGAGGGGAGGFRTGASLSLTAGNAYTTTIGAGGAQNGNTGTPGDGSDSILSGTGITTITSTGGGRASSNSAAAGGAGGSGGGGTAQQSVVGVPGAGNTPSITPITGETTTVQGYAGGTAYGTGDNTEGGGGGGGASAVGTNAVSGTGGNGGAGTNSSITGSVVGYAGGGGAGSNNPSATGGTATYGGGAGRIRTAGNGNAGDGTANTGGGGGGHADQHITGNPGSGGSGVVILRRLTGITVGGGNLTLQSNDTTASTANPDYADMVMLMENASGTATLNTDIKGYISEDSGVTFTQGTLVDEGTWGTNKKILAFHDLDISAQTGSAMCYKITTHNQSAGVKETKVHATSIGWR